MLKKPRRFASGSRFALLINKLALMVFGRSQDFQNHRLVFEASAFWLLVKSKFNCKIWPRWWRHYLAKFLISRQVAKQSAGKSPAKCARRARLPVGCAAFLVVELVKTLASGPPACRTQDVVHASTEFIEVPAHMFMLDNTNRWVSIAKGDI